MTISNYGMNLEYAILKDSYNGRLYLQFMQICKKIWIGFDLKPPYPVIHSVIWFLYGAYKSLFAVMKHYESFWISIALQYDHEHKRRNTKYFLLEKNVE